MTDSDGKPRRPVLPGRKTRLERIMGSPQTTILGSFAVVILVGAVILWLPWSHRGETVGLVEALFTATSAVCVTGLIVVDTGSTFTPFGQTVILVLIQTGGLGLMTFAAMVFRMAGRRMSLQSRALVSDTFFQKDMGAEFWSAVKGILIMTFGLEAVGALLLFAFSPHGTSLASSAYSCLFHSVSAFCNAGFSLRSDSLIGLRNNPGFLIVMMILIVVGGLGHSVVQEVVESLRERGGGAAVKPRGLTLHARSVLIVTGILLIGGTLAILICGLTPQETSWPEKIGNALFQSVSARTAGFNSVDMAALPSSSLFLLTLLMFVGGSPGSCAGGVKTTSLVVWFGRLKADLSGREEVQLMGRKLPVELVNRVNLLLSLAAIWNVAGILLLLATQTHLASSPMSLFFEQISAFGTVGLSTGITADLTLTGKLWLIATMFVGRLGPLTVAVWMFPRSTVSVSYPTERIMIG